MKRLMQFIIEKLRTYHRQRRLHRAINQAYAAFSRQYPRWANSLFDMHFLRQQAASVLNSQHPGTAEALAEAYLKMIRDQKLVQAHHRAAVLPVADAFVQLMAAELQAQGQTVSARRYRR